MTLQFSPVETEVVAHRVTAQSAISPTTTRYRTLYKRSLDIFLTLLSAPIVVPLVLLMVVLITLDGGNPFYSQMRVGKNGRAFRMWKLRTMVNNADELLEGYLNKKPAARLEWDATQKLKNDPRITWIGRILRKTSLDELPQLFNVLNGTMSLVGPRPMMLSQRDDYKGTSYYNLRPGITGLWQVSDRNECEFAGRVAFDDAYDNALSLKTDFQVLVQTVGVVLRGTGY